ncbi:IS3 family transposase [Yersinia kristensenii]|uniref:IS3 family transposase n=1 Tax=Yersinia kristensenii TaxID=28152 RepID=UPI00067DC420
MRSVLVIFLPPVLDGVKYCRYETRSQGIADVIDYIDSFYNLKRRHYRLGYISPDEYERRLQQCA